MWRKLPDEAKKPATDNPAYQALACQCDHPHSYMRVWFGQLVDGIQFFAGFRRNSCRQDCVAQAVRCFLPGRERPVQEFLQRLAPSRFHARRHQINAGEAHDWIRIFPGRVRQRGPEIGLDCLVVGRASRGYAHRGRPDKSTSRILYAAGSEILALRIIELYVTNGAGRPAHFFDHIFTAIGFFAQPPIR